MSQLANARQQSEYRVDLAKEWPRLCASDLGVWQKASNLDSIGSSEFAQILRVTVEKRETTFALSFMHYDFHIHDAIRVEYRVATDGSSFPRGYSCIERETRSAGGNGVVAAVTLARWGARVLLTGNAIGDDDHGRLVSRELEAIENLTFKASLEQDVVTPYAILLRAGHFDVGTLLSPQASNIELKRLSRNSKDAQFFGGAREGWGEGGGTVHLEAASQDYSALIGSMAGVAAIYGQLMEHEVALATQLALSEAATRLYAERFGGLESIPTLEELEACLPVAR